MTTEERITIIQNKAKRNADAKVAAEDARIKEIDELVEKIQEWEYRVNAIITLANVCIKNGVKIPEDQCSYAHYKSGEKYGYMHEFIVDGITHHVGLIRTWGMCGKGTYKYIGINNGGACGCYDFWTDGNDVWAVHEDNRNDIREPRIEDMKKFIKEFPVFEKAFLAWVDSLDE